MTFGKSHLNLRQGRWLVIIGYETENYINTYNYICVYDSICIY